MVYWALCCLYKKRQLARHHRLGRKQSILLYLYSLYTYYYYIRIVRIGIYITKYHIVTEAMRVAAMQTIIFLHMKESENTLTHQFDLSFFRGQMIPIGSWCLFLRIKESKQWLTISALVGKHGSRPQRNGDSWERFHSTKQGSEESFCPCSTMENTSRVIQMFISDPGFFLSCTYAEQTRPHTHIGLLSHRITIFILFKQGPFLVFFNLVTYIDKFTALGQQLLIYIPQTKPRLTFFKLKCLETTHHTFPDYSL